MERSTPLGSRPSDLMWSSISECIFPQRSEIMWVVGVRNPQVALDPQLYFHGRWHLRNRKILAVCNIIGPILTISNFQKHLPDDRAAVSMVKGGKFFSTRIRSQLVREKRSPIERRDKSDPSVDGDDGPRPPTSRTHYFRFNESGIFRVRSV